MLYPDGKDTNRCSNGSDESSRWGAGNQMSYLTIFILGIIAAKLIPIVAFFDVPQRRPVSRMEQRYTPEREDSAE